MLALLLLFFTTHTRAEVFSFKDEVYVVDLRIDEGTGLAHAQIQNKEVQLPKKLELRLRSEDSKPTKPVELVLLPNEPQAYEGRLHSPYGSYAAAGMELNLDFGAQKRRLVPSSAKSR